MNIKPISGYLLCRPYFFKNSPFKSDKEEVGIVQRSEVLGVGDTLLDDAAILREAPCKVGDIILHSYISDAFEIKFDIYRLVHFSQVKARLEVNHHMDADQISKLISESEARILKAIEALQDPNKPSTATPEEIAAVSTAVEGVTTANQNLKDAVAALSI